MIPLLCAVVAGSFAATPASPRPDPPSPQLESRRLRSAAVYLGTVTAVRRLGGLEGLTEEGQGRMEATVAIARALRAPSGVSAPTEALVRFDSRAPAPEGEGFRSFVAGEAVLVFADGFESAYPRDLFHGDPAGLGSQIRGLRDFVAGMDAGTMTLHGLTPATRAAEVRLYDEALAALARLGK